MRIAGLLYENAEARLDFSLYQNEYCFVILKFKIIKRVHL